MDARAEASRALSRAVAVLRAGGVVALPTDTLYGLAADPWSPRALDALRSLKGRGAEKTFLLLLDEADRVRPLASRLPPLFERASTAFWPGPVTLLLPAVPGLPPSLVGPGGAVAVRVPSCAFVREMVSALGRPVTGTSANPGGRIPAATAEDVEALYPRGGARPDLLLDGGPAPGGPPSSLLDLSRDPPMLLREGAVPLARIVELLGAPVDGPPGRG